MRKKVGGAVGKHLCYVVASSSKHGSKVEFSIGQHPSHESFQSILV